ERDTGLRDTLSAPYQILRLAEAGEPIRLPRPARRDWFYIRDAVAGLTALLDSERPSYKVYNVAAGFEWSLAEFCALLREGRPNLRWSVAAPGMANVDLYDAADRSPMSVA